MCVFIFILLCMFNMFNQAIFPQLLVGLTFFYIYIFLFVCLGEDFLATYLECLQMRFFTLGVKTPIKIGIWGLGNNRLAIMHSSGVIRFPNHCLGDFFAVVF